MRAGLEVRHVSTASRDVQTIQIEPATVERVDRRQSRRAHPVGSPHDHGGRHRAAAALPVVRDARLGICAGGEIDPKAGRERHAARHPPPGLGHGPQSLFTNGTRRGIITADGIDPDIDQRGTPDVEHRQRHVCRHQRAALELLTFESRPTARSGTHEKSPRTATALPRPVSSAAPLENRTDDVPWSGKTRFSGPFRERHMGGHDRDSGLSKKRRQLDHAGRRASGASPAGAAAAGINTPSVTHACRCTW